MVTPKVDFDFRNQVNFSYKESATDQIKRSTVTAAEFIRRVLQHLLPKRFIKVRYYGLLSPAHRHLLMKARQLLEGVAARVKNEDAKTGKPVAELCCPRCGGRLTLIGPITPRGHSP